MLSKSKKQLIRSLEHKKFRKETGCFLAEGNKLVSDMIPFFDCVLLLCHTSWLATQGDIRVKELIIAGDEDMKKTSLLKNPQDVLAIFKIPEYRLDIVSLEGRLTIILDGIQDPGNLGTIVRVADWFGIENLICSQDCADIYNPKSVQATMGALARVKVHYTSLSDFLSMNTQLPVYGTFPEGENLYLQSLPDQGFIIMGNEGNGIRDSIVRFISQKLSIPNYPVGRDTSESLNVAIATAVICGEFRRRQMAES